MVAVRAVVVRAVAKVAVAKVAGGEGRGAARGGAGGDERRGVRLETERDGEQEVEWRGGGERERRERADDGVWERRGEGGAGEGEGR